MRSSTLLLTACLSSLLMLSCSDDPSTLGTGRGTTRSSSGSSGGTGSSGDDGTSEGAGSSGTSGTTASGGAPTGSAAEICVATINELRKTKGLPAYARWTDNETCSDGQAKTDATTRNPHGAFGKCEEFGQNECPGWDGTPEQMIPQCLKAMWGEGPGGGHYEAMANKKYTKVACGFGTASNGQIWAVQNFR